MDVTLSRLEPVIVAVSPPATVKMWSMASRCGVPAAATVTVMKAFAEKEA
jgi:hypothetical protein